MSGVDVAVAKSPSADPDADATTREFIDYTEYLPSDISRYLWRIRDLHTRHGESRAQLDDHMGLFAKTRASPTARTVARLAPTTGDADSGPSGGAQLLDGVNGMSRVMESVSDKELELRFLISQCLNDVSHSARESVVEALRLQEHVERHHSRIVAIHGKLDTITVPSRDPTPEERKPPKPAPSDSRVRITLRLNSNIESSSPQPPQTTRGRGRPPLGRTPARRALKTPAVPVTTEEDDDDDDDDEEEGGWEDVPETPSVTATKVKKKASKRGPKPPPTDPALSGGAPSYYPDGTLIPNDQLPWNQLTNQELARLRKRMKKNSAWTPSVTMIVRELETLGRGPNNKGSFRHQWEGKQEVFIGPEEGGIGDPQKILPDDGVGARENKGMRLNRAKKRKREEEKKERAREAQRSGLDPVETEKKLQEEEQERQRKEQQAKRRKKKEEEEAVRLAKEKAEREASEKAARERAEHEKAVAEAVAAAIAKAEAEAEAKARAEAAAAAQAAEEMAERERQEKLAKEKAAREKAAKEKAAAEAAKLAAEAAVAKKSGPPESDDELSDVPDLEEPIAAINNTTSSSSGEAPLKLPHRTSKRNSARPPSRPPRGISATPRPKRGSVVSSAPGLSPPPATTLVTRKSVTPARSAGSAKATTGKKPGGSTAKRTTGGARRKKRGRGAEAVDATDDQDEDLNKYCLCDEVSRGTMVACENDDCPKVWFHIGCVGLSKEEAEKEDLKWYCPICEDNMQGRRGGKRRRKN